MSNTTTLDLSLSSQEQTILENTTGGSINAYAVLYDSTGFISETTLVNAGILESGGSYSIPLTTSTQPTLNGGKLYIVVQSLSTGSTGTISTGDFANQSFLNTGSASAYDFSYDSFEVTLKNSGSDAGNITAVNGFALPMEASVTYNNGTSETVGYAVPGSTIVSDIGNVSSSGTYSYSQGPLAGSFRMSTSPTEANPANGGTLTTGGAFPQTAWLPYVDALENTTVASDVLISGQFNGAADAAGIWHNGGYYAYQLQWDGTNGVFWLAPTADSQIQGYIKLTPNDIAQNAYSQTGSVSIYANETDATPLATVAVGANNQWGAVLAQFFTGLTAGYYGSVGTSPNAQATGTIDLNHNNNWAPTYAFGGTGGNVTSTLGLPAGTQTSDPYSQIFFKNSNSYGSPYSDALMSQYSTGGPLLNVQQTGTPADVSTINLTVFAPGETPTGYTTPTLADYIAPPGGSYTAATTLYSGNNLALNFYSAVANNQGISLAANATVTLSILTGYNGSTPTFTTVTFDGATAGGLFQNWTLSPDGHGGYTAAASGATGNPGYMVIFGLPTPASGVSWYQLGVSGSGGADAKTFNLYVTTNSGGQIENTAYAGQSGAVQVDGLASVSATGLTTQYVSNIKVNFATGTTVSFDPRLAVEVTGSISNYGSGFAVTPDAPVVGLLNGGTFSALAGQTAQASNTITTADSSGLSLAWTGYNPNSGVVSNVGTDGNSTITGYGWTGAAPVQGTIASNGSIAGWVNGFTNKTNPGDTALITITGSAGHSGTMQAVADADGDWIANGLTLGNGTYTITMQDAVNSNGTLSPVTAASTPLVLTVTNGSNTIAANTIIIACFAEGTALETEAGARPVEALRVGERVRTLGGPCEEIRWIGQRSVDCLRHPEPEAVLPVRIAAGAFGPGLPARDLILSPDHAIYAEGVLVPVKHLVNGTSIRQQAVARITYFHVELARHEVIFAEGLPTESYLDTGDRASFANAAGAIALHPAWGGQARDVSLIMEALGYAPLRVTGPEVERLRARLGTSPAAARRGRRARRARPRAGAA
ncbi:Hint domain-containing protein [Acidisoma sp. C75]